MASKKAPKGSWTGTAKDYAPGKGKMPKGMHMMPDGSMMANKAMKRPMKKGK